MQFSCEVPQALDDAPPLVYILIRIVEILIGQLYRPTPLRVTAALTLDIRLSFCQSPPLACRSILGGYGKVRSVHRSDLLSLLSARRISFGNVVILLIRGGSRK